MVPSSDWLVDRHYAEIDFAYLTLVGCLLPLFLILILTIVQVLTSQETCKCFTHIISSSGKDSGPQLVMEAVLLTLPLLLLLFIPVVSSVNCILLGISALCWSTSVAGKEHFTFIIPTAQVHFICA